ncbi:hypothetical protein [Hyunsoonleella ulvae]|uniref:hypothetical protein n=1 Tax=Hyunsoonleella ulvae TaxID=2799948 RepID=UPI00193993D8|nr:hypothetical protein [Hyunsoonleella ulvae]
MKSLTILLCIFSFSVLHAQYSEGKIYLKNDSVSKGLIKVKTFGGIKFKTSENSEPLEYDYKTILGYDVKGWQYRYEKKKETRKPELFKLILEGKISLYSNFVYNPGRVDSNGFSIGASSSTVYYIKVKEQLLAIGNRLKKKDIIIFEDCPLLIEKIQKKEFKKWDIYDIVEFYNEDCN